MEIIVMKKFLSTFALAAMIGVAGCDNSEETIIEQPVLEETTPPAVINETVIVEPAAPAPVMPTDSVTVTTPAAPTTTTP